MPKNVLQDMVKPKNSLRDVLPLKDQKQKRELQYEEEKTWYAPVEEKYVAPNEVGGTSGNGNSKKNRLWIVALFSAAFLLFALSFLFSYAKVAIVPKTQDITLSQSLTATKDASDGLSFDVIAVSLTESKDVTAGAGRDVVTPAKGTIILYNSFSTAPQKLLVDTRLEGSNGKIYKTLVAVTIPGMKGTTPGSVKVGIYAEQGGPEYDSGPLDFKVFGFKGTPKYDKFYARSEGSLSGGSKGPQYAISDLDREATVSELKNTLSTKLLKNATGQIPSGFILYKDAAYTDINENDVTTSPSAVPGTVTMTMQGTLYGVLLDGNKLTKAIADKVVDKYNGEPIHIPGLNNLVFSMSAPQDLATLKDSTSIDFKLSGPVKIIWDVNADKLAADLLGKKKSDFTSVLTAYPNIASADVTLRPLWLRSFPDKIKNINVTVTEPQ